MNYLSVDVSSISLLIGDTNSEETNIINQTETNEIIKRLSARVRKSFCYSVSCLCTNWRSIVSTSATILSVGLR